MCVPKAIPTRPLVIAIYLHEFLTHSEGSKFIIQAREYPSTTMPGPFDHIFTTQAEFVS